MSQNTGTLVAAAVRPSDSNDPIASAFSNEIKGGHQSYATLPERDAIILARRDWGMLVTIYNDSTPSNNAIYQLQYNFVDTNLSNNANWVVFSSNVAGSSNTSWLNTVITISGTPSATASNGDRYLIAPVASGVWFGNENRIAQWNSNINNWVFTTPLNGYMVVVGDTDNTIFRYMGTYSAGLWIQEATSLIRYTQFVGNGSVYTSNSVIDMFHYATNIVILCQFNTSSSGATVSVNINNIGYAPVKKNLYGTLTDLSFNDISVGVTYEMVFDGVNFQLMNPTFPVSDLQIKNIIQDEVVTVPVNYQYLIYGDLQLAGVSTLINHGSVVTINGNMIVGPSSSFNNFGTYESPVLLEKLKYSATFSFIGGLTYAVNHNLGSTDIIWSVNDSSGTPLPLGGTSISGNIISPYTIILESGVNYNNTRVIIIA